MKRVYFFIGTLSKGGAERTVSNLTLNMDQSIEKKVILFGTQTRIDYPVEAQLCYIDRTKKNSVLNKFLTIISRAHHLKALKKSDPAATYISFLEYPNLINLLSSRSARSIISVRNHMSTKHRAGLKALFWNTLIRLTYNRADQIIAVSEDIRQDLISHYGISAAKIRVIYNYYQLDDIRRFAEEPIDPDLNPFFDQPVLITMGRMNQQKGQWHLIRAFKAIKAHVPNAKLMILGEGQLKPQLEKLAKDMNLETDVCFPGFCSNPHKYIARAQVFILPSLYEGFPNALAEAMACGVPVIAADCHSGPREILAPAETSAPEIPYGVQLQRFGLLYPVDSSSIWSATEPLTTSEKTLADLAVQILLDSDLHRHFTQQASERINQFDIKNIVHEWEELL